MTDKILDTIEKKARQYENSKKDKEIKTILAMDVEGVIDVLDDSGKPVYLTEEGEVIDKVVDEGLVYVPPSRDDLPYFLPDKENVLRLIEDNSDSSDDDLYIRLWEYHRAISDLPNELFYDLLVLWDVHTYLIDRLHFSPILYLYAVKERGKSRTGRGCIYVSRRGVFTETLREPDIIRWGNDHKAAIGFDVKDFPKKLQRANCDDLILARFEKGSTASRTLFPEKGAFRDTKTFKLFGATIVMTNRPIDDILESRAISIDMKPSFRKFENKVEQEGGLDLKAELTAFRFRHKNTKIKEFASPANGRLGDILSPLNDIVRTFFPNEVDRFNSLLKIIVEQKQDAATDTFEAQVVEAVMSAERLVTEGFLSVETITSLFNEGKNEQFAIRNETIGRILKGLGFSSRRTTGGKRGIYYDPELVRNIAYQYGLLGISDTASHPSLTPPVEAGKRRRLRGVSKNYER